MQSHSVQKVKIVTLYNQSDQKQEKYMMSLDVLGQGKYGKVYKATNMQKRDQVYAVKVIQFGSQKIREEYLKELEIIKKLPKCANLVRIHPQHFESGKHFYIFEEYCPHGTLYDERVRKKNKHESYTEKQCFSMFLQIVNGFIKLREAGIFHEDIKPQNILKKNNLYKITDFGISQLADQAELSVVRKGTLTYMPPEKLSSNRYAPTSKSQIYSLGVTLYETIFGSHPYLTKRPNDYKQYLTMMGSKQLKSVDELKKRFPGASLAFDKLVRVILRMLDYKEAKRLSLQELIDYAHNSEPYKSMTISQISIESQNKSGWVQDYQEIGHSTIYYQSDCTENIEQALKFNDCSISTQTMVTLLKFLRQISAYLQQGITHCQNSKIYELKEADSSSGLPIQTYLQFLIVSINCYTFEQLTKHLTNFPSFPPNQPTMISLQGDIQYTQDQYMKVIKKLDIKTREFVLTNKGVKGAQIAQQASQIFSKIYSSVNCVRINFKDDILAIIFCKYCSEVLDYLAIALQVIRKQGKNSELETLVKKRQYECINEIIRKFNEYESAQRTELENVISMEMEGGKQILIDIETNSDDFEILDFDEE